jgi:hypothetical protein
VLRLACAIIIIDYVAAAAAAVVVESSELHLTECALLLLLFLIKRLRCRILLRFPTCKLHLFQGYAHILSQNPGHASQWQLEPC